MPQFERHIHRLGAPNVAADRLFIRVLSVDKDETGAPSREILECEKELMAADLLQAGVGSDQKPSGAGSAQGFLAIDATGCSA
jgi:hypothetical protein